jgi:hypothetical protein
MSCCGKNREQFLTRIPGDPLSSRNVPPASRRVQGPAHTRVFFEYLGNTGMTVVGPVTGKRYRFDRPGAKLEVDLRDRRPLAAVPHLRQTLAP